MPKLCYTYDLILFQTRVKVFRVHLQVFVQYVKPVQTGYPQDSDSRLVVREQQQQQQQNNNTIADMCYNCTIDA